MKKILLISGGLCSGKSSLAKNLRKESNFHLIATSKVLIENIKDKKKELTFNNIIEEGRLLDEETRSKWILKLIKETMEDISGSSKTEMRRSVDTNDLYVVVDSVNTLEQVNRVRARYGLRVVHVHLDVPRDVLKKRISNRFKHGTSTKYKFSLNDIDKFTVSPENEDLKKDADLVINTNNSDRSDTYVRVGARLELFAPPSHRCVDVLVGGQYGSEGKGQIAAYLSNNYDVLVRVGGPNAGHSVVNSHGKYVYHHLPSGCKDTNAEVLIGPGAVVNPKNILKEIKDCGLKEGRIFIDPQVMVITDSDIDSEASKIVGEIASTGSGSGSAAARKILERGDSTLVLAKDVEELKPYIGSTYDRLEYGYARGKKIMLEGTQGSALSIHHGIYPFVTSRDTNVAGCLAEAGISPSRVRQIIMVVRSYPIRVANPDKENTTSGYIKSEIDFETISKRSGVGSEEIKALEITSTTKRKRRVGEFDWTQYRKACALNAPTDIVLTFSDYIDVVNKDARRFEQLSEKTIKFIEELERVAHAPVTLISTRFNERAIIDRRDWW